jgi:hypothetical protein
MSMLYAPTAGGRIETTGTLFIYSKRDTTPLVSSHTFCDASGVVPRSLLLSHLVLRAGYNEQEEQR